MSLEQSPYQNQPLVNDPKAEQYVIGSLLVDPTAYTLVSQYLDEDCFYDPMCRDIWKAVDNMGKQGMPIDVISVSAELSKQKSNVTALDLMNISAQIASSAHVEYHAIRLQDLGRRRKLWVVGQQLSKVGLSEEILTADAHQEAIESIGGVFEKADGVFTLDDAMNSLNEIMVKNATVGGVTTGTKTGMERFDEKGGLQKSDLIIVAGETSGKDEPRTLHDKTRHRERSKGCFLLYGNDEGAAYGTSAFCQDEHPGQQYPLFGQSGAKRDKDD